MQSIANQNYSNDSLFRTANDFTLVNRLLQNPRYNIPETLRTKMTKCIEAVLDSPIAELNTKLTAINTAVAMDKLNIDIVKTSMPKRTENVIIKQLSTEELIEQAKELQRFLPKHTEE